MSGKIWVVVLVNRTEPERKVYLLGAHSSREAALRHKDEIEEGGEGLAHVVEMTLDGRQPPVLLGVAVPGPDEALPGECKKNTPNG